MGNRAVGYEDLCANILLRSHKGAISVSEDNEVKPIEYEAPWDPFEAPAAHFYKNSKKKLRGVVVVLGGRPVLLDKIGIPGTHSGALPRPFGETPIAPS